MVRTSSPADFGVAAGDGGVVGVRAELVAPRVERPVEGDPAVAVA